MAQFTIVAAFVVGAYLGYFFSYGIAQFPEEEGFRKTISILATIVAFVGWVAGIVRFIGILSDLSALAEPDSGKALAWLLGVVISMVFGTIHGCQERMGQKKEMSEKEDLVV